MHRGDTSDPHVARPVRYRDASSSKALLNSEDTPKALAGNNVAKPRFLINLILLSLTRDAVYPDVQALVQVGVESSLAESQRELKQHQNCNGEWPRHHLFPSGPISHSQNQT